MKNYYCESCNYTTNIKTHFKRHLNTSKHLRVSQMLGEISPTPKNVSPKLAENEQKSIIKNIQCKYCDKIFNHRSSLSKHLKYSCKKNNEKSF